MVGSVSSKVATNTNILSIPKANTNMGNTTLQYYDYGYDLAVIGYNYLTIRV
jgi:hypothetical protein